MHALVLTLSAILAAIVLLWAVLFRIVGTRPRRQKRRTKPAEPPVSVVDLVDQWHAGGQK